MLGESPKRISLILISIVHSFIFQNSDSISLGRVISAGKFKEGTLWNHQCSKSGRMWRNRRRVEKNRLQKSSKWNESVSHSAMPYSLRPWAAPHQVPLSMGFSRQGYWSSLPFPSPGDLPDPGIEPRSLALQADSLPTELPGKPQRTVRCLEFHTYLISFVAKRRFQDTWLPQALRCILDLLKQGPLFRSLNKEWGSTHWSSFKHTFPCFCLEWCNYTLLSKPKESGGLQSVGSQKVRHDWATNTFTFSFSKP